MPATKTVWQRRKVIVSHELPIPAGWRAEHPSDARPRVNLFLQPVTGEISFDASPVAETYAPTTFRETMPSTGT
jgi:hypothetical protein